MVSSLHQVAGRTATSTSLVDHPIDRAQFGRLARRRLREAVIASLRKYEVKRAELRAEIAEVPISTNEGCDQLQCNDERTETFAYIRLLEDMQRAACACQRLLASSSISKRVEIGSVVVIEDDYGRQALYCCQQHCPFTDELIISLGGEAVPLLALSVEAPVFKALEGKIEGQQVSYSAGVNNRRADSRSAPLFRSTIVAIA